MEAIDTGFTADTKMKLNLSGEMQRRELCGHRNWINKHVKGTEMYLKSPYGKRT